MYPGEDIWLKWFCVHSGGGVKVVVSAATVMVTTRTDESDVVDDASDDVEEGENADDILKRKLATLTILCFCFFKPCRTAVFFFLSPLVRQ